MRILHTSDWHIGKRLGQFSRLDEQRLVLQEIVQVADEQEVDVVVVAGDLWDVFSPAADATELLYQTLRQLTQGGRRPVLAIAGNHDSPERVEAAEILARACGIVLAGFPHTRPAIFDFPDGGRVEITAPGFVQLVLPRYGYPARFVLTPYANEYRMRQHLGCDVTEGLRDALQKHWGALALQYCDTAGVNVLVSHLFMTDGKMARPDEPIDEARPIVAVGGAGEMFAAMVPPAIQYVAMGHLHRRIVTAREPVPVVYPGSILQYSFSEAGQPKYVEIVDIRPGSPAVFRPVELQAGWPLIRLKARSVEEALQMLAQSVHNAYIELTVIVPDFLSADVVKAIHLAHPSIVQLIPQPVSSTVDDVVQRQALPDPGREIRQLFTEFFASRHGVGPDGALTALFEEVIGMSRDEA